MENKIMKIVDKICAMESFDCRSLNKKDEARKIMDIVEIPNNAIIQEIPLDWDRQIVILFEIPNDEHYYELFAGTGEDKEFHCELSEIGIIREDCFYFYDEDGIENKLLPINYFKNNK